MPYCKYCGAKKVKRQGKFGEFWGCSNYPKCKGRAKTTKAKTNWNLLTLLLVGVIIVFLLYRFGFLRILAN